MLLTHQRPSDHSFAAAWAILALAIVVACPSTSSGQSANDLTPPSGVAAVVNGTLLRNLHYEFTIGALNTDFYCCVGIDRKSIHFMLPALSGVAVYFVPLSRIARVEPGMITLSDGSTLSATLYRHEGRFPRFEGRERALVGVSDSGEVRYAMADVRSIVSVTSNPPSVPDDFKYDPWGNFTSHSQLAATIVTRTNSVIEISSLDIFRVSEEQYEKSDPLDVELDNRALIALRLADVRLVRDVRTVGRGDLGLFRDRVRARVLTKSGRSMDIGFFQGYEWFVGGVTSVGYVKVALRDIKSFTIR